MFVLACWIWWGISDADSFEEIQCGPVVVAEHLLADLLDQPAASPHAARVVVDEATLHRGEKPSAAFPVPTASRVAIALLTVGLMPPAVVTTVVLGPLALTRSWLAAVDLDVQRLPDKIISRCPWWLLITVMITATFACDLALC
jgi:hypothetical protein